MSEGHVSVSYQGWTHTQVWRVYGHVCPCTGAGRLVCVMVSVAASGPVRVWVALRAWVRCGGLGSTPVRGVRRAAHPPAEVVQHHDVGVHVVQVVAVGRVLLAGPDVRAGALVREHVVTVLGLVVHTVKPCHLGRRRDPASSCDRRAARAQ